MVLHEATRIVNSVWEATCPTLVSFTANVSSATGALFLFEGSLASTCEFVSCQARRVRLENVCYRQGDV